MSPLNIKTNIRNLKRLSHGMTCLAALLIASTATTGSAFAQDAVFRIRAGGKTSKVAGKISASSPTGVTINGKEVPAHEIRKVAYANEPPIVDRARKQMENGRYSDAIEELKKIKGNVNKNIRREIDFINAYSTAQVSLRGGGITPKSAATAVKTFITTYSDSHNLVPAIDQFARLAFAAGLPDVSINEFKKLQNSNWLEYQLKGYFHAGDMLVLRGKLAEAKQAFSAITAMGGTDDMTQNYKLLAACHLAKIEGLQGNVDNARKTLETIIKQENPDNKKLFANLYNCLGAVHEKSGRLKEAARAYLHTELLFATETEAHAEAVYRLAKIWPKLEETDRANDSRDLVKSRYRNSYWSTQL